MKSIRALQLFTTVVQKLNQGVPEIMSYIDFGALFCLLFWANKKVRNEPHKQKRTKSLLEKQKKGEYNHMTKTIFDFTLFFVLKQRKAAKERRINPTHQNTLFC